MTAIAHYLNLIANDRNHPLDTQKWENIQSIQEELQQAEAITFGINLLNQTNTPLKLASLDMSDLVKNAILRHQDSAQKNSVKLDFIKPAKAVFVAADPTKINQVIDILMTNAIRVSKDKEVALRIFTDQDGIPHFAVRDSGRGIPDKYIRRIFDPYVEVDPQGNGYFSKLGIEFTLAREIIRSHNGKIWVENMMGRGSTFFFTLQVGD